MNIFQFSPQEVLLWFKNLRSFSNMAVSTGNGADIEAGHPEVWEVAGGDYRAG